MSATLDDIHHELKEMRDNQVKIATAQAVSKQITENNHRDNKKDSDRFYEGLRNLTNQVNSLDCKTHAEKLKNHGREIKWVKTCVIGILSGGGILTAIGSIFAVISKMNGG